MPGTVEQPEFVTQQFGAEYLLHPERGRCYRKVRAEVQTWEEDGEPRSQCWVEWNTVGSSSLALLQDLGGIEHEKTGEVCPMEQATIDRIEAWAYANGY